MSSVTQRITQIKQPRGGYIKPSMFEQHSFDDEIVLNTNENISPAIIGMVVDYLTRFMMGTKIDDAFSISILGARCAEKFFNQIGSIDIAKELLFNITDLDDYSIINACKLVSYDVWYRNPRNAFVAKGVDDINPDIDTIENIRIMVKRCLNFWKEYGPIVKDGFNFEPSGYTQTVTSGDGDFLTADTLWDFKVSKDKPKPKNTLQLLMYWIMGKHSGQEIYDNIDKIGIFNPRLNVAYRLDISLISDEVIEEVENDIICY